jgi:hypothetical protein
MSGMNIIMKTVLIKIISIAGMIVCLLWKGTAYYAKLIYEDGGPSKSTEKRKVMEREFLPAYRINMPTPELLQVLSIIKEKNKGKISKKELIEELQDLKIIPVYPPSQSRSATPQQAQGDTLSPRKALAVHRSGVEKEKESEVLR